MTDPSPLTAKQWAVARLAADGHSVKQIALARGISISAVHHTLERIAFRWRLDPTRDIRVQIAKRLAA